MPYKDVSTIAGVPGHNAPVDAPIWLAQLIEHAVSNYGDHPNVKERLHWFAARIIAASAVPDSRQFEILRLLTARTKQTTRKGGPQ